MDNCEQIGRKQLGGGANGTFDRSSRPRCALRGWERKTGRNLSYHMHGVREDERPLEARLVRHHDHRAPLHAAASLPGV